jgi:predicted GIY-YIG superfamily endonuclease
MIRRMTETKVNDAPEWSVYIVRCADESLYTGIAKNVSARLEAHNKGKGASYTRSRRPVRLIHQEHGMTRSQALVREAAIKSLPRADKQKLARDQPGLDKTSPT